MFATLTISGSAAASTQTACGRRARTIRSATIRCSRRSLSLRSSCSPRWSSTAGSELRRVEPARATVETLAPERRTSSSGLAPMKAASGRAAAEAEAGRELLAHGAEEGRRVVGGGGADDDLAGEHDLAHLARRDPRCGGRDGGFELAGRAGAADLGVRGRVRVEQRQRRLGAQPGEAGARAPRPLAPASSPGCTTALTVRKVRSPLRQSESSGRTSEAGRQRGPGRGGAAVGVEGEAAEPDRPGAGRQPARLVERPRRRRSAGTRRRRRRSGAAPREVASWATPSPARANPRSGCSQQNQRSEASREAKTAAQGSADLDLDGDADQRPPLAARSPGSSALAQAGRAASLSRCRGQWRSRRSAPFRPGRAGGPSARRPRSCRPSRSPRSSSCGARRRRFWPGRSPRTG